MVREMGGRFEREGTGVYLWLILVDVWQKITKFCKAIILQLKKIKWQKYSFNIKIMYVYMCGSYEVNYEVKIRSFHIEKNDIRFFFFNHRNLWPPLKVKVAQYVRPFCDPMDYTVPGILQARILEWVVAFPSSRGSSQPRDQAQVFCIAGGFFIN